MVVQTSTTIYFAACPIQARESFKAGANYALSQLQHTNRWRKVSEELPEKDFDVLIKFDNNNISIGKYKSEEYFSCINGDEYPISEVTEW